MGRRLLVLGALALGSLLGLDARAQNLLTNSTFDANVSGWSNQAFLSWSSNDADGSAGSGSAQVRNNGTPPVTIKSGQCVAITGGLTYAYAADYFIPSGQTDSGEADLILSFYSSSNCVIGYITGDMVGGALIDTWDHLEGRLDAPAGAGYAKVELGSNKLSGMTGTNYYVQMDNIFLPEASAGLQQGLAAAALLAAARGRAGGRTPRRGPVRGRG
jgi:hypothetical protein